MIKNYNLFRKMYDTALEPINGDKTLKSIFNMITTRHSKLTSTIYFDSNGKMKKYSFAKLRENSIKYGNYIKNRLQNVDKNSTVILKLPNNLHWCEILWGILMSGHRALLVESKTSVDGVINLATQANAKVIVCDDSNTYTNLEKIDFDNIINDLSANSSNDFDWANEIIFCSSGTTGDVKLIVYTGASLCGQIAEAYNILDIADDMNICYPNKLGEVRNLAMIPFHHVFGLLVLVFWYQWFGGAMVYPASNTPSDLLEACQKGKVSHVLSVPLLWDSIVSSTNRKIALMDSKKQKLIQKMIDYNLGKISKKEAGFIARKIVKKSLQKKLLGTNIHFCISGGGNLSKETLEFVNGIGYPLHNGYGMTEIGVSSVNLSLSLTDILTGDIGIPFYGITYKIKPNGENKNLGELLVKSAAMHDRQIVGGVSQEAELDDEGFFHTGDIAELGENGHYYLRGRIKDIIINANGENVFPDELELYFKDLNHVIHFTILGIKNPKTQSEDIDMVLELDNTIKNDEIKQLKELILNTKLPGNNHIQNIYLTKSKLPIANSMKIKRFQVKKAIEQNSADYISLTENNHENKKVKFDQETIKNILEPTKEIFSEVLILPEFKITDDGHWINDLGGDSMSYVEMIQKVQNKFDITFDESLYGKMACLNDVVIEIKKIFDQKSK